MSSFVLNSLSFCWCVNAVVADSSQIMVHIITP